jgi:hypothetical protein
MAEETFVPEEDAPKADYVVVYMRGSSHDSEDGQRRHVDPELAEFLVTNKLARRAGE